MLQVLLVSAGVMALLSLCQILRIRPISKFLHRELGGKVLVETAYRSPHRRRQLFPRVDVSVIVKPPPSDFEIWAVRIWSLKSLLLLPLEYGLFSLMARVRRWTTDTARIGRYRLHVRSPAPLGEALDTLDPKLKRQLEVLFDQGFRELFSDDGTVTGRVTFITAPWRLHEKCLRALPEMLRGIAAAVAAHENGGPTRP